MFRRDVPTPQHRNGRGPQSRHAISSDSVRPLARVSGHEFKAEFSGLVNSKFNGMIGGTTVRPMCVIRILSLVVELIILCGPEDVLQMLGQNPPGLTVDVLQDIFSSTERLDATLSSFQRRRRSSRALRLPKPGADSRTTRGPSRLRT
jgi:hypothetical protein